jgi:heptosyltransferase-2
MAIRGKILVIRGGAIGDFILTLPALSALRRQFPDTHLELIGYPHIADLAVASRIVDRVRSIESRPLAGFFAREGELSGELTEYFSTFDIVISYLYDPDKIFQANVARCSRAQFIVGPHRPDEAEKIHATTVFLKPLERLAIFDVDSTPRLSLNSQPSTRNLLAIHPGSGSERKNWPERNWSELLARLRDETNWNFLLVAGEAEAARVRKLAQDLPTTRAQVAENLLLIQLAEQLSKSTLFVGHDSGISHLAAAVDLPGIILWGHTSEEIWRPKNPGMKLLQSTKGLAGISVENVFSEINESIRKRPS